MNRQELIPKLSNKLSFHQFDNGTYFIHQKEYDHRIKITQDVYDLLQLVDGNKSLLVIKEEMKPMDSVSIDFLYELLYLNLGKYGIILSDFSEIKKKEKPSYLKLSFIVISPKIIKKITPYLKILFIPKVMGSILILCGILILIGIIGNYNTILKLNLEEINWGLFFFLGFISVTFHEFGHVTAAEYFGAKHGGIGGGFYLLSPVYFADVTDIWKLNPKQRIIVNLAGIFELIMCSIFLIIGFFIGYGLLLVLGTIIFIRTLFNLNPFLRSDGYWILTDSLGIANLYKISNQCLSNFIKSIIYKRVKFNYSKKNILLFLYSSFNFIMLFIFVLYVLVYNSQSVIYFPYNLYIFLESIIDNTRTFQVKDMGQFVIPLLFYYLFFSFLIGLLKRQKQNKQSEIKKSNLQFKNES